MDGLLVINKPIGPTSHDVVARVRRALGERRAGHTGTLDPGASGVLPIVLGRATRLARFLSGQDKTYRATIRLGIETDTYDSAGTAAPSPYSGPWPARDAIERTLDAFRGTFQQQPPAYSAKKIGGERSYRLARRAVPSARDGRGRSLPDLPGPPALPAPVEVTVRRLDLLEAAGDRVTLEIECSAGFYVRSLAHDLGRGLETGAYLEALERLASGSLRIEHAIALDRVERDHEAARSAVVPLAGMLSDLPSRRLTATGVRRTGHGQDLRPADFDGAPGETNVPFVRLIDPGGDLVGVAEPSATPGLLHPLVVLM